VLRTGLSNFRFRTDKKAFAPLAQLAEQLTLKLALIRDKRYAAGARPVVLEFVREIDQDHF